MDRSSPPATGASIDRREWLARSGAVAALLAAAGVLPAAAQSAAQAAAPAGGWQAAAFEARTVPELVRALGVSAPVESADVQLTAPDIAEDGSAVAVTVACSRPGVRRLMLLVEKNPNLLAAAFDLTDAVEPNVATRIKMAQSSPVLAVAVMADARVLFTRKEVKVTLGGCGN